MSSEQLKMTTVGFTKLLAGLQLANIGDDEGAGSAAWELSEPDVGAGLGLLSTMQQALMAQGTNYHFGRLMAEGDGREGKGGEATGI